MAFNNLPHWLRQGLSGGIGLAILGLVPFILAYIYLSKHTNPGGGAIMFLLFIPVVLFIAGGIAGIIHSKSKLGAYTVLLIISTIPFIYNMEVFDTLSSLRISWHLFRVAIIETSRVFLIVSLVFYSSMRIGLRSLPPSS